MARGPALTPDLPGSPVARESFVPMKVAQAEAPGGITVRPARYISAHTPFG